jgi:hypothetical protein
MKRLETVPARNPIFPLHAEGRLKPWTEFRSLHQFGDELLRQLLRDPERAKS